MSLVKLDLGPLQDSDRKWIIYTSPEMIEALDKALEEEIKRILKEND